MELYDAVLIPLIISIIELFKFYGLKKKFSPIVSLILGIIGGVVYLYPESPKSGILVGMVIGLSACGLYSSGKTLAVKDKESEE